MRSKIKGNLGIIIFFMLLITIAYLVIDFGATPLYGSIMCGQETCICMCLGDNCECTYNASGCLCRGKNLVCPRIPRGWNSFLSEQPGVPHVPTSLSQII